MKNRLIMLLLGFVVLYATPSFAEEAAVNMAENGVTGVSKDSTDADPSPEAQLPSPADGSSTNETT